MSPPGQKMVLSVEPFVSASVSSDRLTTLGGFIDYTAGMATPNSASEHFHVFYTLLVYLSADLFLRHPVLGMLKKQAHSLFVSEAKGNHVPRAISQMYACVRELGSVAIYLFYS
jgi:hypothetical protein